MKKLTLLLILTLGFSLAQANGPADPSGYFKKKNWSWNIKDYGKLTITSTYVAEPISHPNLMHIEVECPTKGKKKRIYPIVEDYKYCGIDSISPAGKILVVHFADYDDKNSSYCSKKRVERFSLPEVCKKKRNAASLKKKKRK